MSDKVKLRVDLSSKEDTSNKTTSLSSSSTDTQYPSAKAVYDALQNGFSGDYNDLTNKPTIPSDVSDLTDSSNTQFTPKSHTHGYIQNNGTIDIVNGSDTHVLSEGPIPIGGELATLIGDFVLFVDKSDSYKIKMSQQIQSTAIKNSIALANIGSSANENQYKINSLINTALGNKANTSALSDYIQKSNTTGLVKNDGTIDTNAYLTTHQDISGKIDTAGTGLSKTGTTLNHSNSVTSLTTASLKKIKYDSQGHITETDTVGASDLPSHTHSDTQLNWDGSAMVYSASPLDMCLNEELSPNRLAYLSGDNLDVEYSTNGGSTWTSYGASATEKSKIITASQTFTSGKGATASSNNQLRITIHSGLTSGVASQIYVKTRKLMIYYSTGGGSGNKVKIQTNTYGNPDTWNDVQEYNIGGNAGWNTYPLNITYGGGASQTNGTRIKSIRLIFTCTSNHNFNVQKIRLYGENCWTAQSNYAKTGHIYNTDINQNTTFPAKIIKSGGTNSEILLANGDVSTKVTSWQSTPSDSNVPSEKLVKDYVDDLVGSAITYIVGSGN